MFYLMRHADASFNADRDFDRPLTQAGVESVKRLAIEHQQILKPIERIICSPYLRTRQTAEILSQKLSLKPVIVEKNITPNHSVNEAISAIEKHWCDNLLVVTHQPLIGSLICFLEYGETFGYEGVTTSSIYSYLLPWPGLGCAQRQSLLSV